MYLISKRKAKVAHIWTGTDTVCRMFSTGGMNKSKYIQAHASELPICQLCAKQNIEVKEKSAGHSKCKKCGLPIAWGKSKNGKPMPVNIGGSEHWDACSAAKTKLAIANCKVYLPESSGCITGSEYVEAECECIPWIGCEICCKETIPDEQQAHLDSI